MLASKREKEIREALDFAVESLEEIVKNGIIAHKEGTAESHSLHLGICIGIASRTLGKIQDKDANT